MADVTKGAELLNLPLDVQRLRGDASSAPEDQPPAVQVIVTAEDDEHQGDDPADAGPRIYTCPLRAWRPDAWSVASRRPGGTTDAAWLDWHPALVSPGAAALGARFARRTGVSMDQAAWRGWMAVTVAFEVALRVAAGEDDLLILQFDGHKGEPLRFSEDGHLVQPVVRITDGQAGLVAPIDSDPFSIDE